MQHSEWLQYLSLPRVTGPDAPRNHGRNNVDTGDSSLLPVQDGDLIRRWKWAFVWQTSLTEDHRCGRSNCRPALSMRKMRQTGAESERLPRILALVTKLTFVEMKAQGAARRRIIGNGAFSAEADV